MSMDIEERFARIETSIDKMADNQAHLDGTLAELAEAQLDFVKETRSRFQEHDQRFEESQKASEEFRLELREIALQDAERGRQMDERIAKLVSAIGG